MNKIMQMVDKAERFTTIHDAVLAQSYLNFLKRQFSGKEPTDQPPTTDETTKGLFKCPECQSIQTNWQRMSEDSLRSTVECSNCSYKWVPKRAQ